MKERPILFSAPMVRGILEDRKTMTRRVVKPQPDAMHSGNPYWFVGGYRLSDTVHNPLRCPYGQPGDRLWVRESYALEDMTDGQRIVYRADKQAAWTSRMYEKFYLASDYQVAKWQSSMFMPRWASRILLEIVSVRVERLQDISEADAEAEGAPFELGELERLILGAKAKYRSGFIRLWQSINGDGSWDANPWVWVIEFKRINAQ